MKSRYPRRIYILASVSLMLLAGTCVLWRLKVEDRLHRSEVEALERAQTLRLEDISTNSTIFGIQIIGSNDFRLQLARSLVLLKLCDLETFTRITNAIGIAREDIVTAAAATNRPPLVTVSDRSAFRSLTWCAAALAHEARHIELAKERGATNQFVPTYGPARGYRDFQRDELECNALELRALKRMGAPSREVNFVKSQDGTHFDVNRDGKWDAQDERLRREQALEQIVPRR